MICLVSGSEVFNLNGILLFALFITLMLGLDDS